MEQAQHDHQSGVGHDTSEQDEIERRGGALADGMPEKIRAGAGRARGLHGPVMFGAMRIVLQRVTRARVTIDGREAGAIERGFCVLVGFAHADTAAEVDWMAEKVAGLRLFTDAAGKMNLALDEVGGAVLVVSQFTLYGDAAK